MYKKNLKHYLKGLESILKQNENRPSRNSKKDS